MDLKKLTTADWVIAGGAIVTLIAAFLPWFKLDIGIATFTASGWDVGFLWAGLPVIIGIAMVAYLVLITFAPDTKLPDAPWDVILLGLGVLAALLVVLKLLIGESSSSFSWDRQYGLFLAVLGTIALAVGGFLRFQANGGNIKDLGSSFNGGKRPPPPPSS